MLLYLLALSRDLPRLSRSQANHRWEPHPSTDISNVRLGIVGLGGIGSEVARLAASLEIEAIGLRRTVTGNEICETWTHDRLDDLLGWADAIAVTAPLTDDTRDLFDRAAFARMRPGAWFVNVGRGEIVDEAALIDALVSGHLGGAALDVFAVEPLPPDSPLSGSPERHHHATFVGHHRHLAPPSGRHVRRELPPARRRPPAGERHRRRLTAGVTNVVQPPAPSHARWPAFFSQSISWSEGTGSEIT